ncbi:hypothetical protein BAUCODRAFT_29416 [Baudoinia panamericana UAMH 10762]|uniref:Uncharacterized protein n=1 Tax=Baudoinia panamericana (strain UAMH 10762) TaxID=717646 RepID=M2MVP8_BAUPA|nr:uncharacterized protein BAUCODRAFT_29416 [Baudoinia panamericana UAMH 10762]EMD01032.1 hypothetical protein BAUCODRAFT_29416 [Baudoinia panamericana UAMH 10762]
MLMVSEGEKQDLSRQTDAVPSRPSDRSTRRRRCRHPSIFACLLPEAVPIPQYVIEAPVSTSHYCPAT